MNKVDTYEQHIHNIFPELSIEEINLNDSGLDNDIIEINNELIFRFPKNQAAVNKLNKEVKVLRLIKKYITLNIPDIFYEHQEVIGYFMICGIALSKEILNELDEKTQHLAAEELATFLKELHSIPRDRILEFDIPNSGATCEYKYWVNLYQRLQNEVFPQRDSSVQESEKNHLKTFLDDRNNFDYEPKLIHGNLESSHILFNKQKNSLGGIIDFGTAGWGDPAIDIAVLIHNYGEGFVRRFHQTYPELDLYFERAKFYARTFALPWALSGNKSKNLTEFLHQLGDFYKL